MAVSGWKPALAAALLMFGFAAGRVGQRPAVEAVSPSPALVRVREVAADNQGRVRLVLEETRQREIGGAIDDAQIRQLLLAAAQDPADAGLRFASVDLLRRQPEGEGVRRALMMALERDPNPGVRLKALEGLRPFAADPGVRQLLANTLERDDNSGVRTQAIDLFVQPGQKDTIDVLQRLMQREDNTYIRSRSQRALEAMNASWETF
jgi:HEAT repeat protein